jgi:citrate lyase subunit beta / citryl-CoA lyase
MILRSMLYTPGNSLRLVTKAATLPMDAVILDLEDAVPLADKETARILGRDAMKLFKTRGILVFARVNSMASGFTEEDAAVVVTKDLDGLMLAKTESASDVKKLDTILGKAERRSKLAAGRIKVVTLIESAKGVMNSYAIACASKRIVALAFGAGDYYRDLGKDVSTLSYDETELLFARSQIVNVSRAAGLQAIDTPYLGLLTDRERFMNEVKIASQLGFNGKQCIHPTQINPVNKAFSPSEGEVAYAGRVVEAFKSAEAKGLGAVSFEGKMIDRMNYMQAKELLSKKESMSIREKKEDEVSAVSILDIFR